MGLAPAIGGPAGTAQRWRARAAGPSGHVIAGGRSPRSNPAGSPRPLRGLATTDGQRRLATTYRHGCTAGASSLYITGVTIRASSVLETSPPMITHASGAESALACRPVRSE